MDYKKLKSELKGTGGSWAKELALRLEKAAAKKNTSPRAGHKKQSTQQAYGRLKGNTGA